MENEKICVLTVTQAIRIAKIIAVAPDERLPVIEEALSKADIHLETLVELIENAGISKPAALIDTVEFLTELTAGRELTERGYLIRPDDFKQFCLGKSIKPNIAKQHLFKSGYIESSREESSGKQNYTQSIYSNGKAQRFVVIKDFGKKETR